MEKLQAALARAREQRDPTEVRQPRVTSRVRSRQLAEAEVLAERWSGIEMFEPSTSRMRSARIFADDATSQGQHFDILRTKLMLEMRRNKWTRIAITSATASCGKTTVACNLIAGLGRQPESRGMLFDMDFRRPAVSKLFGASPTSSFADVLEETVDYVDQAMRLDRNTAISMTTRSVRDPSKLIQKARTAEIFDEVQAHFIPDIMLFDLPPVLVSDETRAFLKLVDAVIIVGAAETTTVQQIDETEREVAQYAEVAGVVLNKCRFLDDGYGYSY